MRKKLLIATLVCLAVVACEPHGTPQKPKTQEAGSALASFLHTPTARSR